MLIELQVMREFEILPKPLNDIYNSGYTQSDTEICVYSFIQESRIEGNNF